MKDKSGRRGHTPKCRKIIFEALAETVEGTAALEKEQSRVDHRTATELEKADKDNAEKDSVA